MKTFKDRQGRTWEISIDVAALKRVKGVLDVDLTHVLEGDLIKRLSSDVILLCDVIYVLCQPQADEQFGENSDEQFGRSLDADCFAEAEAAFWDELVNFFRSRGGDWIRRMRQKVAETEAKALEITERKAGTHLDKVLGDLDAFLEKRLQTAGISSTDLPG